MADETIDFDLDSLTLGDVEAIEEAAGVPFGDLFPNGMPSAKGLIAFVYITKHKEDPEFTWEDAKQVKVSSLASAADDAVPPTGNVA